MLQVFTQTPATTAGVYDGAPRTVAPVLYEGRIDASDLEGSRRFSIRLADSKRERNGARDIVNRLYGWRGYGSDHEIADGPDCTTFVASEGERTAGTLTLTIDSPHGLAADATFSDELRHFRSLPRASLCELTKFAFDPSPESKPLLASMFHVIYLYGMQHFSCTDLLIEVNPRHVRFYQVMLGFRACGPLRTNEAVDAPSQLMHLPVAKIRASIDLARQQGSRKGHSLYPLFLSEKEERAVSRRVSWTTRRTPAEGFVPREPFLANLLPLFGRKETIQAEVARRATA